LILKSVSFEAARQMRRGLDQVVLSGDFGQERPSRRWMQLFAGFRAGLSQQELDDRQRNPARALGLE
jgi:hypothetical protein